MPRLLWLVALLVSSLLMACGQKGPLYLPSDHQQSAAHHLSHYPKNRR